MSRIGRRLIAIPSGVEIALDGPRITVRGPRGELSRSVPAVIQVRVDDAQDLRDALRADSALVAEYEALKLRLAEEHGDDIAAYTAGKRTFVARVLAITRVELGRR